MQNINHKPLQNKSDKLYQNFWKTHPFFLNQSKRTDVLKLLTHVLFPISILTRMLLIKRYLPCSEKFNKKYTDRIKWFYVVIFLYLLFFVCKYVLRSRENVLILHHVKSSFCQRRAAILSSLFRTFEKRGVRTVQHLCYIVKVKRGSDYPAFIKDII